MQQNIVTTLSVSVPLSIDSMELAAKVNAAIKTAFDNLQGMDGVTASLDQDVKKGEGEAAKPVKAKVTKAPRKAEGVRDTKAAIDRVVEPAKASEEKAAEDKPEQGDGKVTKPSLLDQARALAGKAA